MYQWILLNFMSFSSIVCIYLSVKFLLCLSFCVYLLTFLVNKDILSYCILFISSFTFVYLYSLYLCRSAVSLFRSHHYLVIKDVYSILQLNGELQLATTTPPRRHKLSTRAVSSIAGLCHSEHTATRGEMAILYKGHAA